MSKRREPTDDIDRDSPIALVMRRWPATVRVLVRRKMACAGCALSPFCTVEDVARDYAVALEPLLEELRCAAEGRSGDDAAEAGLGHGLGPGSGPRSAEKDLPLKDCERRSARGPRRIHGLAAAILALLVLVSTGCGPRLDELEPVPDPGPGPGDAPAYEGEIPASRIDGTGPGEVEASLGDGRLMGRPARPERPAPEFELSDQQGRPWRPEMARGRVLVIFFGYTHCPDICPQTMAVLSRALDQLGDEAQGVQLALVSVDPERDRPEVLGPYMSAFAPDALGLSGDLEMTRRVAEAFGVRFEKEFPEVASAEGEQAAASSERYSVAHSGTVFLIDAHGQIRVTHGGVLSPDEIANDLALLLSERPGAGE